ncbi:MAG: hypothetical protein ABIK09_15180 [Pseudomonadota bacterium]
MRRAALVCVALAILVAGCDWGVDGMDRLEAQYGSGDGADAVDALPEDVAAVDLGEVAGEGVGGTWLMRMMLTGGMKVFADPSALELTNLFLVTVPEEGGVATLTFCDQLTTVDLPGGMGETQLPEASREAIGAVAVNLELDGDGVPVAQEIAWTWGLKDMEDPFTDALPEGPDDPRVWDQDDDGNPGLTIHVLAPEGDRYMVRRAVWSIEAGALSGDGLWLSGSLTFTVHEGAVGATSAALKTVAPILPSDEGNVWQLRKVAGVGEDSGWDCARLKDEHAGVFKDAP